jgi:GntR family transcriptional regulator
LYIRTEEALRELISSERLKPGDRLPSEIELAREFGVARSTIREALRHLQARGTVRRVHGLGTIVTQLQSKIVAGLETLESLESLAKRQGWACGTINVTISETELSETQAERLARAVGTPAVLIQRIKTRDEAKIALMESVIPTDVLTIDDVRAEFKTSIIDMFLRCTPRTVAYARTKVVVEVPPRHITRALGIKSEAPLLLLCEAFHDIDDALICANRNWFIPGALSLELVRKPP